MGLISLRAVGDLAFGELDVLYRHGVATALRNKGIVALLAQVKKYLAADFVFGNLETSFFVPHHPTTSMVADPQSITGLSEIGFNILNIANNHIAEYGEKGVTSTIAFLEEREIKIVGKKAFNGFASTPMYVDTNFGTVGWIGYSMVQDQNWGNTYAFVDWRDKDHVIEDIARLSQDVDMIIVSLHWGHEFVNHPSPAQIKFARSLIETGAKVVLGHHPHILQGLEHYKNGVIFYSLGNFIFDFWQKRLKQTAIADIRFNRKTATGSMIPIMIGQDLMPRAIKESNSGTWSSRLNELNSLINPGISEDGYKKKAQREKIRWRQELQKYYLLNFWRLGMRKNIYLMRMFGGKNFKKWYTR